MENIVSFPKNKNNQPKVSELLRLYRTRSGLTQSELARRLGLKTDRMVRKWENGQSLPESSRLKKLVELYLVEGIFIRGHERQEAQVLWSTVKLAFELQSPSFETYNIFDAAWFESLLAARPVNFELSPTTEHTTPPCPAPTLKPALHNLPVQLTQIRGREKELDRIKTLLEKARLITLTGPAGVGKTRLAIKAGWNLVGKFRDGVWLVRLDHLVRAEELLETIIFELGGNTARHKDSGDLQEYLHSKNLLLVFDGCDKLVPECGILFDKLLKGCPYLKIFVTSRENLAIGAETIFKVTSLGLTGANSQRTGLISAAANLFIERAGEVQIAFNQSLTEQDYQVIEQICCKLDGLPLAIELAASLVEGFSLEQIDAQLVEPFKLLKKGRSSALNSFERFNSVESSLAFSYDRLSSQERTMLQFLARLSDSVGLTLELIEQKYRETGEDVSRVLDMVNSLIKKSLVESQFDEEENEMRFSLLNIVRKYILKHIPYKA